MSASVALIVWDGSPVPLQNVKANHGVLYAQLPSGTHHLRVGDALLVSGSQVVSVVLARDVETVQQALAEKVVYTEEVKTTEPDRTPDLLDTFNVPHGFDQFNVEGLGHVAHMYVSTYHRILWSCLRLYGKQKIKDAWAAVATDIHTNAERTGFEVHSIVKDETFGTFGTLDEAKKHHTKGKTEIHRAFVSKGSSLFLKLA